MLELKNDSLLVSILDPVADRERLGTRYCTAGFIFQVEDLARDPARLLLAGPTFPHSYNLFDGQGMPDAFQPHLVVEQDADANPTRVLGIGIGLIDATANVVAERCTWTVERGEGSLGFRTTQEAGRWRFGLERVVSLRGRTIRVHTTLTNTGDRHVPFQWYPHPFFPLYPTGECCRMSVPVTLPENPGYELLDNGFIAMKHLPWTGSENHFQLVGHRADAPISFVQKHPVTSLVTATIDYVPTRMPIWGNRFTFSFEPYLERVVSQKEAASWSITYDF
jgi:hypothetical protein